jgi:hypothetical protein
VNHCPKKLNQIMKKIISETIFGFILVTGSLVIPGCSKDLNQDAQQETPQFSNQNTASTALSSSCGTIPSDLQPPQGNQLSLQAYAVGVQIYQVRRSTLDPTVISWVNTAPSARLYSKPDLTIQIGTHFSGPTWQFSKGIFKDDKVVATKLKAVTMDASAIPWLLLKTVDSLSSPKNKITWIQRVCTVGGLAPTRPVTEENLGETDSIPYTAIYRFFTKE